MSLDYADSFQKVGAATVANPAVAITITLGWVPRYVRVINVNNLSSYEYFSGMDAGTSLDNGNHADTQWSVNANNGITLTANGFTMGTDICDTASDVVRWLAIR